MDRLGARRCRREILPGTLLLLTALTAPGIAVAAGDPCALVAISAGGQHVLALRGDGRVVSWGANTLGQLGRSVPGYDADPGEVTGLPDVTAIAAGGTHSLALGADGSVWAWGGNASGQLGLRLNSTSSPLPAKIDLPPAVAIAAGRTHSLVLVADGAVWAMGTNAVGELGDGRSGYGWSSNSPVASKTPTGVTAIAAGDSTSLAIGPGGALWSWGYTSTPTPRQVTGLAFIRAIAVGGQHLMALQGNGLLWTWGNNTHGELGDGTTGPGGTPGVIVLTDIVSISAGAFHSVAVRANGSVWAWGKGSLGQLGNGANEDSPLPVQALPAGSGAVVVSAGDSVSLALDGNGRLRSFGLVSPDAIRVIPVAREAQGPSGVTAVAAGLAHTVSAAADAEWTFGVNATGQLGDGSYLNSDRAVRVASLGGATSLAAGFRHTLAVTGDGAVWAWGDNRSGQLGTAGSSLAATPVKTAGLPPAVAVAASASHSHALASDGSLWAWGTNDHGELGNSTLVDAKSPVQTTFPTGTRVVAVAAGGSHALAVSASGQVWSWGGNESRQLGDLRSARDPRPSPVPGIAGAVLVAAGSSHSLALLADGTVWAWGADGSGQCGDGSVRPYADVPVQVSGLTDAVAIAAGANHSMALRRDGSVVAWGRNDVGQLGDGSRTDSPVPVRVTGIDGATAIAAGFTHSVAVVGGRLRVWGAERYGELGLGDAPGSALPVSDGIDPVPPDQGNALRLARSGDDIRLEISGFRAGAWRISRDPEPSAIGRTTWLDVARSSPQIDTGAIATPGAVFYAIRGLSPCSLAPGP